MSGCISQVLHHSHFGCFNTDIMMTTDNRSNRPAAHAGGRRPLAACVRCRPLPCSMLHAPSATFPFALKLLRTTVSRSQTPVRQPTTRRSPRASQEQPQPHQAMGSWSSRPEVGNHTVQGPQGSLHSCRVCGSLACATLTHEASMALHAAACRSLAGRRAAAGRLQLPLCLGAGRPWRRPPTRSPHCPRSSCSKCWAI